MAILTAFEQRISELRLELQVLIIGWAAQAAFLLALRSYRVLSGPGSFVLGLAAIVVVSLACYASMEITGRAFVKRDNLSETEQWEQFCTSIFTRVMAAAWFAIFLFLDGWFVLVMKTGAVLEKWFPALVVGPEIRLSFPLLFSVGIFLLCWYVVDVLRSSPDSWLRVRRR